MPSSALIYTVIVAALIFDYINGFHDTANAIATSVLTRALSIPMAILMASGLNFLGAILSTAVAHTIGKGIVAPETVTETVILAAIVGAIGWNLITWWRGLPSSSSHALIGGVIGAVVAFKGFSALNYQGLIKIFSALIISPIMGLIVGYFFMVGVYWLFRKSRPDKLNRWFKRIQVVSAGFMALTHGSNDAQKTMGIITLTLVAGGMLDTFVVPLWVIIACATAMALGTAAGGWRIIRTVGKKIMGLRPVHGFASETTAAIIISTATALGAPVSTTQVISSSIMGVGSSQNIHAIRWGVARNIGLAWIFTLPCSAIMAGLSYLGLRMVFGN